jgi:DNA-binding NtrC family response regulator
MKPSQVRVLCVDSSDSRRNKLAAVLEDADFDVWTAHNIRDAVQMADVLRPAAVLADQFSTLCHERDLEKLRTLYPQLPVLVHSAAPSMAVLSADTGDFAAVRTGDLEIVMAILTLLLESNHPSGTEAEAVHAT